MDRKPKDFFWIFLRNGLDVDPTFGACDDHGNRCCAVDEDRQIKLPGYVHCFPDKDFTDFLSIGTGLVSHQHLTDHLGG